MDRQETLVPDTSMEICSAWVCAWPIRLARQRLNASGLDVTIGSPAKEILVSNPAAPRQAQILQKFLNIDFRRALPGIAPRKAR